MFLHDLNEMALRASNRCSEQLTSTNCWIACCVVSSLQDSFCAYVGKPSKVRPGRFCVVAMAKQIAWISRDFQLTSLIFDCVVLHCEDATQEFM